MFQQTSDHDLVHKIFSSPQSTPEPRKSHRMDPQNNSYHMGSSPVVLTKAGGAYRGATEQHEGFTSPASKTTSESPYSPSSFDSRHSQDDKTDGEGTADEVTADYVEDQPHLRSRSGSGTSDQSLSDEENERSRTSRRHNLSESNDTKYKTPIHKQLFHKKQEQGGMTADDIDMKDYRLGMVGEGMKNWQMVYHRNQDDISRLKIEAQSLDKRNRSLEKQLADCRNLTAAKEYWRLNFSNDRERDYQAQADNFPRRRGKSTNSQQ